ncbi:MAG TPA: hypothetical protein VGF43_18070 [Dongiaceae bacterium]
MALVEDAGGPLAPAFAVMARRGTLDEQSQQLRARYAEALAAYRQGNWDAARSAVVAALDLKLTDGPSQTMLAHIDWWESNPPRSGWTGAWQLTEK